MKLEFIERRITASPAHKTHAEKKLSKLDKLFRYEAEALVKFSQEKNIYTVEVTVHYSHMVFRAQESGMDMRDAIDKAVTAIERQILKNKTRLSKRFRNTGFEQDIGEPDALSIQDVEEEGAFEVIRKKSFPVKPMAVDEAILQMNLLGHSFYVFRSSDDSGRFAVVYKRNDGGYGLITSSD